MAFTYLLSLLAFATLASAQASTTLGNIRPTTPITTAPAPSTTIYTFVFFLGNGGNTDFTVCEPGLINWAVEPLLTSDVPVPVTLYATQGSAYHGITNQAILGNGSWQWPAVNLPAGSYTLYGQASGYKFQGTTTMTIVPGTSTACLPKSSSSSASSTSTPANLPVSTPLSSAPSSSASIIVPVGSTSTGSHLSTGAKAGIATGASLLVAAALIALLTFFLCRNRNRRTSRQFRDDFGGGTGKFKGLHSGTDGPEPPAAVASYGYPEDAFGRTSPLGATPAGTERASAYGMMRADSDPFSEKSALPAGAQPPVWPNVAPVPQARARPRHSPSSSSSRVSVPESMEMTPTSAFGHSTQPSESHSMGAGVALSRSTSESEHRRSRGPMTRKPVPVYDLDDPQLHESNPSIHSSGSNSGDLHNLNVAPNVPTFPITHVPGAAPELQHKASFGDAYGNVHYLIPDMPPERTVSPPIAVRNVRG
ncbi:hypothetical protein SISSUDRAFT_1049805 [Sistotremastrum suecicum HHB10207 ss-3]|uniref:Uncharacterized protein n=1 Tax=Sistotremastrum suecicum HHB10207 ss-3 TaxID=1314776 RepID=A0A166BKB2_9AGAM|nr:hypothetical protein SISSUDRAFT_1049805 [Sistotremastrum suecicum HHB10207 ss-3]